METTENRDLPARMPYWRTRNTMPVPEDFVPLRLVLQPTGAVVELTQPDVLFGRHSRADIRLPLPDVSRRHCRFFFTQGVWQVLDLNSLNGVFLNDQPIRQATVHPGDLLRIGGFSFVIELGATSADATQADTAEGLIHGIFKTLPAPLDDSEPHRLAS